MDEAGKGPVIGPMMIAGVVVEDNRLIELERLGVKDSKLLSPMRRNFLAAKIKEIAKNKISNNCDFGEFGNYFGWL